MWVADELEYEVGCGVADCGDGEHDEAVGVDGQIVELPAVSDEVAVNARVVLRAVVREYRAVRVAPATSPPTRY